MSASDNLNSELFHGTGHFFAEGEVVEPSKSRIPHVPLAFASNNLSYSKGYASRAATKSGMLFAPVYRVSPIDKGENLNELGWESEGVLSSKVGFKPEEIVDWGIRED